MLRFQTPKSDRFVECISFVCASVLIVEWLQTIVSVGIWINTLNVTFVNGEYSYIRVWMARAKDWNHYRMYSNITLPERSDEILAPIMSTQSTPSTTSNHKPFTFDKIACNRTTKTHTHIRVQFNGINFHHIAVCTRRRWIMTSNYSLINGAVRVQPL